jgi:hypothetical protein
LNAATIRELTHRTNPTTPQSNPRTRRRWSQRRREQSNSPHTRIAEGAAIVGTLLTPSAVPRGIFGSDVKYGIHQNDSVVINVKATKLWKARCIAEDARRLRLGAAGVMGRAVSARAVGGWRSRGLE